MTPASIKPAFIEHVNITVSNPEATADMLTSIFGWQERWRGASGQGGWTIHVGTEAHYIAVYTTGGDEGLPVSHQKGRPLNHIGLQVDDLDAVERRVVSAGLTPFNHGDYAPGRRFYFFCPDGIEYEIVSYAA
jgi:glyoxylase I family protein